MAIWIFVAGIIGIAIGLVIGYFITVSRLNRQLIELPAQLSNEKNLHDQTKQQLTELQSSLDNKNKELQTEQKERVKFETQANEAGKQVIAIKNENEKSKTELSAQHQEIVNAQSQKAKAETELKDAKNTILQLNEAIVKHTADIASLRTELENWKVTNADISAKYQESLKAIEEQKKFVSDANTALKDAFNSLSAEALKNNNQSFLDLAKTALEKHVNVAKTDLEKRQQAIDSIIKPLNESLNKFDTKIQAIEKAREGAYSEIKVFLNSMQGTTEKLQKETNTLVTALKTSQVRGKYGEIGLRRIVEFAGMSELCDFEEQTSVTTEDGKLRPDLIVKLPGQRKIIVDAKVPLLAYMQAFETTDDNQKKILLAKHSEAVRDHLKKLSAKAYWSQFDESLDYVVMYLQIESSFGAALEIDRTLIEDAINNRIIIATPTTLITMLRTIAFSWQQVKIAENIYQIRDAGVELYNRVTTVMQHIMTLGDNLDTATKNYNKVVGSLENRFIPQAKKMKEIGGSLMDKEIPELQKIETATRKLNEPVISQDIDQSK